MDFIEDPEISSAICTFSKSLPSVEAMSLLSLLGGEVMER